MSRKNKQSIARHDHLVYMDWVQVRDFYTGYDYFISLAKQSGNEKLLESLLFELDNLVSTDDQSLLFDFIEDWYNNNYGK